MDEIRPEDSRPDGSDSIDVQSIDEEIDRDLGWKTARPRRSAAHWDALLNGVKQTSRVGQFFWKIIRGIASVIFFPIMSPLSSHKLYDVDGQMTVVKRGILWRIADGILVRAILSPVILGLFFILLVWLTTHPARVQATQTPGIVGLLHRDVELRTVDGHRLAAWYVPPLDAEDAIISGDRVFNQKWPGVVVCHGLGSSHDQYMSLTKSLHDAGFAVLLLDTRGQGRSANAAVTFGLRERLDVLAGVKHLRSLPSVDATKVCVVGQGTSATAALHAAALDSSIAAVVADDVWPSFDARVKTIFDQPNFKSRWMAPFYQITFELMLRERVGELDLDTLARSMTRQPVLYLAYPGGSDHAPVADVLALAETTAAPHQVIVAQPGKDPGDAAHAGQVAEFLTQACGWVSPRTRTQADIQNLLKKSIK